MAHRATSASTVSPNTPESDKLRFVLHKVDCINGSTKETVLVYAEAPDNAIRQVNVMSDNEYASLVRAYNTTYGA